MFPRCVRLREPCLWPALVSVLSASWMLLSPSEAAEATKASDDNTALAEVIVTAAKRGEQRLQDVPLTVTALSGDSLRAMGADKFSDFAYSVPGLTFQDQGPGDKFYIIRGLQSSGRSTTGVYFDEAVITSSTQTDGDGGGRQPDIKLFDLARIEVLRGPQGTLYGSGSMGGTIRFISNKPDFSQFSGSTQVIGSSTANGGGNLDVNAMVNVPLVKNKLALRAVGWTRSESGFIDNIRLGEKRLNSERTQGGRAELDFEPTDKLTISAFALGQKLKTGGRQRYFVADGDLKQSSNVREPWDEDLWIYSLTGKYQADLADITAVTSYFKRDLTLRFDATPILNFLGAPITARTSEPQGFRIWSNELRMSSKLPGPVQAVLGVYYEQERTSFLSSVDETGPGGLPATPANTLFSRRTAGALNQRAVFGEVNYNLLEALTLTAGGRWFQFSQRNSSALIVPLFLFGGAPGPGPTLSARESGFTKRFALAYKMREGALVYAQAAQGFRPGGTNDTGVTNVSSQFNSDSLWNYELGAKTSWLDKRLAVDLAAYTIRWNKIQVSNLDPTGSFTFIDNAGKAQIDGVEFELTARPFRRLDFSASGSYQNARLTENQPQGGGDLAGLTGDRIPQVPRLTAASFVQYHWPLTWRSGWEGVARADVSYVGSAPTKFRPDDPFYHVRRSYAVENMRLGIDASAWSAFLFVDNVADKRADINVVEGYADRYQIFVNRPRTIGVDLSLRF